MHTSAIFHSALQRAMVLQLPREGNGRGAPTNGALESLPRPVYTELMYLVFDLTRKSHALSFAIDVELAPDDE